MPVELPKYMLSNAYKKALDLITTGTDVEKVNAAHTLWSAAISLTEYQKGAIAYHFADILVKLVRDGNYMQKLHASRTIWYMSQTNDDARLSFDKAGAIEPLIALIPIAEHSVDWMVDHRDVARGALKALAENPMLKEKIASTGFSL